MPRNHIVHIGLMLAALALSYVLPFELLLLSYAILGPAHYMTEISWLHDRGYFMRERLWALPFVLLACLGILISQLPLTATVMLAAVMLGLWQTLPPTRMTATVLLGTGAILATGFWQNAAVAGLFAVLLPTVIHVCLFTLIFMTAGAIKAQDRTQGGIVALYLGCIAIIMLLPPGARTTIPTLAEFAAQNFGGIIPALGRLFGQDGWSIDPRFAGFLSFIYTYHYLNWFIKVDIIKWSSMPKRRLAVVAGLSAAATGLYFYNYQIGFTVLLLISLLHVLLELPLNSLSIQQLLNIRPSRV